MLVKHLICISICLTVLFFNLFLCFISYDRLNKSEEQNKHNLVVIYAALSIIGFFSSIASGIGMIVLVTQTLAIFLQG